MEKNITIRTNDKDLADDLHTALTVYFGRHINYTWYDGAWQLGVEADEAEIDSIAEELRNCDDFKEGVINFTID